MTRETDRAGRRAPKRGGPITPETLAPLAAAYRGRPTGRVRSLADARRELQIPSSAEPEVLQLWGTPKDFDLVVYPVADPELPDTVAEFALLRVVKREGRKLLAGDKHTRLRLGEKSNALWIVYGSIATTTDESLVLESLAIGPAFEGQLGLKGDDIAHGISSQLLRLLSPTRILAACTEQLARQRYWLDVAASRGAKPMPSKQRDRLDRITNKPPRRTPASADELAAIAARYIVLYQRGNLRPRAELAREFGLTPTQARDQLRRARQKGYLTPGTPGRAGAQPGPRLTERGWTSPELNPEAVVNIDNEAPKRKRAVNP